MEKITLKDICLLVTDGTHDSPRIIDIGMPLIKGKDISNGRINFDNCDYISNEDYVKVIKRVKPEKNDVLFANIGSIGDIARVTDDTDFAIKNVALFRPNPNKVNEDYFYYFVRNHQFKKGLLNYQSGSAQPYITLDVFRKYKFSFNKNLPAQTKIATVAISYDDLIDTNRRRIQLLEESARLLFREWFVYFRFPGHENVKIVDGVPEGWKNGKIKDLGKIVTGKTPSKKDSRNYNGTIPFIKTPDMHQSTIILKTKESLSEIGASSQNNKYLPPWSILVSCIGTVGVVAMNLFKSQTNQQINSVIPKNSIYRYYSLFCLSRLKPLLEAIGGGSTMANINRNKFENIKITIPSKNVLAKFHQAIDPVFSQIALLSDQNQKLVQARDLLLPRLMSGAIEV